MNKYVLLVIINTPLLLIGILSAVSSYKTKRISQKRCIAELLFWISVGALLICIEPIYNTLIHLKLTNSAPMSIFDIVLLTLVIFCLLLIKQLNEKMTMLSRKIARLHESIAIAEEQRSWDK